MDHIAYLQRFCNLSSQCSLLGSAVPDHAVPLDQIETRIVAPAHAYGPAPGPGARPFRFGVPLRPARRRRLNHVSGNGKRPSIAIT